MKVIVTGAYGSIFTRPINLESLLLCPGASGVLGSAVFDAFERTDAGHTVVGLANSRPGGARNLRQLDLLDSDNVSTFIRDIKPNCECFVS
jgi:nucleoside-diphosphate-sugar epimerase